MILIAAVFFLAACGRANTTATPEPGVSLTPTNTSEPTRMMQETLDYVFIRENDDPTLLRDIGASGNIALVPVLIELLLFTNVMNPEIAPEIDNALGKLTGEDPTQLSYPDWKEWLGPHPEARPPAGFANWKSRLFGFIDPSFTEFFNDGYKALIRLEEIVWGGVPKDGIPDLIDPPVVTAEGATYLGAEERVFGVSINGEHRAYPLRIMNAHEMANDVLGGEPIAFAY